MATTITIDLAAANRLIDGIGEKAHKAARKGLVSAATRIVSHIQTVLIPNANPQPVDRGIYKAAWRPVYSSDGAAIVNDSPHAPIVEWGARAENIKPGRKMIAALVSWIQRKGIGGTVRVSKSGRRTVKKAGAVEAQAIAWAIATSMRKRGIFGPKGLRIAEKAAAVMPKFLQEEIGAELARQFGRK